MRRAATLVLLAACGARSPLGLDASPRDAAATDLSAAEDVAQNQCVSGPIAVQRSDFVVALAVDRSSSMSLDLQGNNAVPRRWDVLRAVLPPALAALDDRISLGALFFPAGGGLECAGPTALQVPFAPSSGDAVARALTELSPAGRTPTFGALVQAERLLRESAVAGARAVVLATDGGPNCNPALDGDRCVCAVGSVGAGQDQCRVDPSLCLDDARAVSQVAAMARRGVATFVIGLDGERQPELVDVLRRMAVAGGRPNPSGARGYYSVQRPEDLAAAVRAVNRSLARCTLRAASRPPARASLSLRVGGVETPRDGTRAEGWDWSAPVGVELVLSGRACDAVAEGAPVTLEATCPP